jgi:hypothetical protein
MEVEWAPEPVWKLLRRDSLFLCRESWLLLMKIIRYISFYFEE